jgi:Ice-binding-like
MTQNLSLSLIRRTTAMAIVFAFVGMRPALADAQPPNLGSAETFGVLAGASVLNTGATTVDGDVGVGPGGTIGGTPMTIAVDSTIHEGDAVAAQSLLDANEAYDALGAMTCGTNLTGQDLGGQNLLPGVYCFDGNALLSGGALMLTGSGPWIFKVTGGLTTAAPVVISGSTQECNGSSVFWQVGGGATIGAGTTFVGNLLAQTGATLGAGATVDGRIIALDPSSLVGLSANTIAACSSGELLPVHDPIKVTGGGQINVPDPDSSGFASFGFNARPESAGGASGHLNYRNHVSRLHVNGTVTDADVVTLNPDGSPKMVRFSGTCQEGPDCTFSVTVEDNGEPAVNDRFGIAVVGSAVDETTADRVVRNGNIQFHLGLTTSLNAGRFSTGDVMALSVSMIPGGAQQPVDAYLVLRLPDGQLLSWTTNGPVLGIVPIARNVKPVNFKGVIASIRIPPGAPAGTYTWLSALTSAGTLNLVSDISERHFVITP